MLEELLGLTETLDYEEFGGISVVGATWRNDNEDLEIRVDVKPGNEDIIQKWSLLCRSEREHKIRFGWGHIEVTDDHILLWPHIKGQFFLWFSGSHENVLTVVGELWQAHQNIIGKWLPFSQFINYPHDLENLLSGGHGKLADGPEPLISIYEGIMQKHGFKTSRPVLRGEGQPNVEPGKIHALIVADTYVVTTQVEAYRTS